MKEIGSSKKILIYIALGVLYFFLTMPFIDLQLLNGYSEIRFTGLLPMAAGLLFGFPGALACALGNMAGDLYSGWDIYCFFGFLGNFLMAWLPYKLWHTLFFFQGHKLMYLDTPGSVLKFVSVSIISSCGSTGVIAAGSHLLGAFQFPSFFYPVSFQFYDLSTLGGMLIFQVCVGIAGVIPHVPERAYRREYRVTNYLIDYGLAGILVAVSLVVLPLILNYRSQDNLADEYCCIIILVCAGMLAVLPMSRSNKTVDTEQTYVPVKGIKSQSILVFLLLLCGFVLFFTIMCYRLLYVDYRVAGSGQLDILWFRVILSVGGAVTVLIIFLAFILKLIDRKVVTPLTAVARYTVQYAKGDRLNKNRIAGLHTDNELEELGKSINLMADEIERFVEDIKVKTIREEKIAAELSIATNIQQGMLPDKWEGTGFDLEPYMRPAREVGGDFYHFTQLDDHRVFVAIADVSGKDISAAMFMVQAKTLMEANSHLSPAEMFTLVNNTLARSNKAMMFVTAFAAVVDREAGTMIYANAGHNAPVCFNNGTTFWMDEEPDFVLGPMEGITYENHTMEIGSDFRLFIYTDGVNEAESLENGFFENDRLFQNARQFFEENGDSKFFVNKMEESLDQFTKGAEQSDDITMMVLGLK